MKILILIALVACFTFAYGDLVCGSDYCSKHQCESPVPESSCKKPSQYRPNHSGKCGCCAACVTLLPEGATCKTYSKELGETPNAICADPLKCVKGQCVKLTPRG